MGSGFAGLQVWVWTSKLLLHQHWLDFIESITLGLVFSWMAVYLKCGILCRTPTNDYSDSCLTFCINKLNSKVSMWFLNVQSEISPLSSVQIRGSCQDAECGHHPRNRPQHRQKPPCSTTRNCQELPRRNWYVVLCSAGQPAIVADQIISNLCYYRCVMRWTAGGRPDRRSWEMHNRFRGKRTQEQCQRLLYLYGLESRRYVMPKVFEIFRDVWLQFQFWKADMSHVFSQLWFGWTIVTSCDIHTIIPPQYVFLVRESSQKTLFQDIWRWSSTRTHLGRCVFYLHIDLHIVSAPQSLLAFPTGQIAKKCPESGCSFCGPFHWLGIMRQKCFRGEADGG